MTIRENPISEYNARHPDAPIELGFTVDHMAALNEIDAALDRGEKIPEEKRRAWADPHPDLPEGAVI